MREEARKQTQKKKDERGDKNMWRSEETRDVEL